MDSGPYEFLLAAFGIHARIVLLWHLFAANMRPAMDQLAQDEERMTLQKSVRTKFGSLSASTSSLTVPKVLSGRCFIPE